MPPTRCRATSYRCRRRCQRLAPSPVRRFRGRSLQRRWEPGRDRQSPGDQAPSPLRCRARSGRRRRSRPAFRVRAASARGAEIEHAAETPARDCSPLDGAGVRCDCYPSLSGDCDDCPHAVSVRPLAISAFPSVQLIDAAQRYASSYSSGRWTLPQLLHSSPSRPSVATSVLPHCEQKKPYGFSWASSE